MRIRVKEYIREDGSNPYKKWFDGLDPHAAAKVATATLRLEMGKSAKGNRNGIDERFQADRG